MIKLIAVDMDGTLLDSQKRMPKDIVPVVRALKEKGVRFVIASGRQAAMIKRDVGELAGELTYIVENGAVIMEGDKQLFADPLCKEDVYRVTKRMLGEKAIHGVLCRPTCAVIAENTPEVFKQNVRMYYASILIVPDLLEACEQYDDVCKIAFFDEGDAGAHEYPIIDSLFSDTLCVTLSGYSWVDVMRPGTHKGKGMRTLQRMLGITPEECMAFGDYNNDIEMLEAVSESYAMENALDSLKAIAKYIAPSNDEDGVMRVIKERFSL